MSKSGLNELKVRGTGFEEYQKAFGDNRIRYNDELFHYDCENMAQGPYLIGTEEEFQGKISARDEIGDRVWEVII